MNMSAYHARLGLLAGLLCPCSTQVVLPLGLCKVAHLLFCSRVQYVIALLRLSMGVQPVTAVLHVKMMMLHTEAWHSLAHSRRCSLTHVTGDPVPVCWAVSCPQWAVRCPLERPGAVVTDFWTSPCLAMQGPRRLGFSRCMP